AQKLNSNRKNRCLPCDKICRLITLPCRSGLHSAWIFCYFVRTSYKLNGSQNHSTEQRQAGSCCRRSTAQQGTTEYDLPRTSAQDLSVDLRTMRTRIHARECPVADGAPQGPQSRQQSCRRQQLGIAMHILSRK